MIQDQVWHTLTSKKPKYQGQVWIVCGPKNNTTFIAKFYDNGTYDVMGLAKQVCREHNAQIEAQIGGAS